MMAKKVPVLLINDIKKNMDKSEQPLFELYSDKINHKAFDIFEALDYDNSDSADYFKERCCELDTKILVTLRDKRRGNEGRTLLHNAARRGSLAAVLSLIRAGHEIEPIDSCVSKLTPLMDAILYKHTEVSIVLVEAGASLFTQDINGENALHYVARSGSSRILRNLIHASNLSREQVMTCANCLTIKKKLPEELAVNAMMREILQGLRKSGDHGPLYSRK